MRFDAHIELRRRWAARRLAVTELYSVMVTLLPCEGDSSLDLGRQVSRPAGLFLRLESQGEARP